MIACDEVRGAIEGRVSDAEIDDAIATAALTHGRPEVTPTFELRGCDDDEVWAVIDASIEALKPRVAVIFTDSVVLDGRMFPGGSIARFIIEHASDDLRAEVWLVVDPFDKDTSDLIVWARTVGVKIAPLGATRVAGRNQRHGLIDWLVSRRSFEKVIIADQTYDTDDPRVTVKRRVTL